MREEGHLYGVRGGKGLSCMFEGKWRKINPCKTQQCCDSQAKLASELEHREWYACDRVSLQLGFFFSLIESFLDQKMHTYPYCKLGIESYRIQDHLIDSCSAEPPWCMSKMNSVDGTLFNEQNYFQIVLGITLPFLAKEPLGSRTSFLLVEETTSKISFL